MGLMSEEFTDEEYDKEISRMFAESRLEKKLEALYLQNKEIIKRLRNWESRIQEPK